ncbi:MAG: BTAD domain-containing putative transcriptional regulator [Acidimicrobiia bacterium]|nr:BTAD domain-containing putative transcriptional regulator [Acidimicrobiia bacterium]
MNSGGLEFHVLGPLEVVSATGQVRITAPKQRAILAVLLLHANEVVSTDRLLDDVWGGDDTEVGVSTLHYHMSKLRERLNGGHGAAGDIITTKAPGYLLEVDAEHLDVLEFEKLVEEARRLRSADPGRALGLLDQALALWHGDPYADFAYDEFAQLERERLHELRRGVVEERVDLLLATGRHAELIPELESLAREHPNRERLWGQLGLALYRIGRQADAVATFGRLREQLGEVGLDLSPQLRELENKILTQDPSLLVETAPDRLRGYSLLGRLGEGAQGVVWHAVQPGLGREVAIKAIRPELANRADFIRRFEAEAQLVAALEHPHIVSLFDFWRDPEGAYLVMPYLRGGDLSGVIHQGPLDPAMVLDLVAAVGSALGYAHQRGVVHRDVTPHNVLFDEDGNPYLGDFGMAGLLGADGPPVTSAPAYMSPEQAAGEKAVVQSDVFSLGVLVHAALTGRIPGVGESLPPVSKLRDDLSVAVDNVIACATAPDTERRYADVPEFMHELAHAVGIGREGAPVLEVEERNPYKGLRAFEESDAGDFFGREMLVTELVQAVARHRLVGAVGPSGCGKSSVIRAGVIPVMRRGALPGSDRWVITDMYPGSQPLGELEAALLRVAVQRPDRLSDALAAPDADLRTVFDELLPRDAEVLLVVDQFEELFTLTTDDAERLRFLDLLVRLVTDPALRVRVIVTMRADFYDRPLEYPEFGELLRRGLVSVTMPAEEQLRTTITGPASRVGVAVDDALVETMVRDVAGQPGALPLLEYALTELFERRSGDQLSLGGYEKTAGVMGALGRRAEELYAQFEIPGRAAAQQVFLRLVTVEEGSEDTRRRIPLTELHGLGIEAAALDRVLDDFGKHRLLTFDRDPETREPTVEVAHEALLSRWDRLRSWIDERRDDLVVYRRLAAAVGEWQGSNRQAAYLISGGRLDHYEHFAAETDIALTAPEKEFLEVSREAAELAQTRRRRNRRLVLTAFASAAVVAAVLAIVAFLAQQRAEREELVARARDLASSAVAAVEEDPALAMNLAVLAVETLPEGEELGPALETALRTAKAADRSAGRYDELDAESWTNADVSPDGSTVAVAHGQQLVVFDSATMETELWSYQEPGPEALGSVAYSSDGEYVVASVVDERDKSTFGGEASDADGSPDPRLLVFDADSGELVHTQVVEVEGACLAWAGPGSWRSDLGLLGVAVQDCDWKGLTFQFVDTTTWDAVYQHPIPPNDLGDVVFAREGTLAAMLSGLNTEPRSWLVDTADWTIVRELPYSDGALSPDGELLVGIDQGPFPVVLEEATTGERIDLLHIGDSLGFGATFSPAGDVLAIGTFSESTLLFDPVTGELIDTIQPVLASSMILGEDHLYLAGSGVVSKWNTTDIDLGDLNTVPLGLYVGWNSIFWTSDGTVVADVYDYATAEWVLYPVDSSTGDLGEAIPYGDGAWLAPLPGDRAVMFRFRESPAGVREHGPLEVLDLSTGEFTEIAGCWMEEQAALAHDPCPNGRPHPAGEIALQGSRDGTEFMIFDSQETEAGETEVFVSIWDTSTFTETSRLSLGVQEGSRRGWLTSLLTEDYIVLHRGRDHPIEVRDRATGEEVLEVVASGNRTEHDRARNRIWVTDGFDTGVALLDLDTFEFRPVTGQVADAVWGLATSPSGDLVAVAAGDGWVRIYTDEGELRHAIPLPNPSDTWWLDEETLVVGTGNGPWTVMTLDPDRLVGAVKASLRRGFTEAECSLYEIDPCPTLEELQGG